MTTPNPFALDADETDETPEPSESKNFAELRKFAREADKQRKELTAQLEEAGKFRAEVEAERRLAAVATSFAEVGLTEKQAKLFEAINPGADLTPDSVKAFAEEYGFTTVESAPAETPAADGQPTPKAEGFKPVNIGTAPVEGMISLDDASKMIREGRYDEAQKLYAAGKVEKLERDANGAPIVDWLAGMKKG